MHPFLDELELQNRQCADEQQQDHGLGGGRAQVLADESVGEYLVDQYRRGLLRTAPGGRSPLES